MRAVLLCSADEFSEAMLTSSGTGLRELSEGGHLRRATSSAVIDSPLSCVKFDFRGTENDPLPTTRAQSTDVAVVVHALFTDQTSKCACRYADAGYWKERLDPKQRFLPCPVAERCLQGNNVNISICDTVGIRCTVDSIMICMHLPDLPGVWGEAVRIVHPGLLPLHWKMSTLPWRRRRVSTV